MTKAKTAAEKATDTAETTSRQRRRRDQGRLRKGAEGLRHVLGYGKDTAEAYEVRHRRRQGHRTLNSEIYSYSKERSKIHRRHQGDHGLQVGP